MKKAIITGITGQDGYYLTKLLLKKGYQVHGLKRRSSLINTQRINEFFDNKKIKDKKFFLHHGDMTDSSSLISLINKVKPEEIYNLAAQSHVKVSFEIPEYTANSDAIGVLRLLEAVKSAGLIKKTKIYQASTSELYGKVQESPQTEKTPFYPRSPYAVAKIYAYWIVVNYREAYGIHASNGILFNHESPLRGETFVTQKIVRAVASIKNGTQDKLYLGNLDAKRDWGHAKDYVKGMYLMMQQEKPDDFVLATGRTETVRNFVEMAFKNINVKLRWEGNGLQEKGINIDTNKVLVSVDPKYFRPTEVELLIGDATKAKNILGWEAEIELEEMVSEMMEIALIKTKEIPESKPEPSFYE